MKSFKIYVLFILASLLTYSQDAGQTFLSLKNTGVEEFLNLYPDYDGRGTILIILDTGVDIGIEGLTKTSTGETKFIDVQDFTHQGDVQLFEAGVDKDGAKTIFKDDDEKYSVIASSSLQHSPKDNKFYIGGFDEARLMNSTSGADDLNGDGDNDDVYVMVVFETTEGTDSYWIVYLDLNGNGDISDDKPLRNYKEKQDAFSFEYFGDLPPLTMGLNVLPDEKSQDPSSGGIVSFHFDDGFHGTHVAGIASGNQIGGINFNGVAPGAKMMSMKLGNNLYSGGATVTESMKKAYLYVDKYSEETNTPCIINMSFGIGSELETLADMETFIENLTKENPYLYISLSAGNEGPGISSVGLPSSNLGTFCSGATLPQDVASDMYGATLNKDVIFNFSSRGGEVNKPDVVSPGASISTVPNWTRWDRAQGTSMSAPYTAGVMSLILSAAVKEYPGVKIPSHLLYKALRESATKLDGYNHLDQGHGNINAVNAYKLLKKYIDEGEIKKFETYTISSTSPNSPNEKAPGLYLRNGSFIRSEDTFTFNIKRNNFQKNDKFYRVFNLVSDSDWLIPIQKKTYLRNDQATFVNVKFDKSKMLEPGLYTARITAYRDDASKFPEFDILSTVVIPYQFSYENNYSKIWSSEKIEQGMIKRYFIELPAGQTEMSIKLSASGKEYARVRCYFFDPNGIKHDTSPAVHTLENKNEVDAYYYNLEPGVYEIIVDGVFMGKGISTYDLTVQFLGINRLDNKIIDSSNNQIEVVNLFSQPANFSLKGQMTGYEIYHQVTISGSEKFRMPFVMRKGEASKEFILELSKQDFSKLTDLALLIYDTNGVVVGSDALSFRNGSVSIKNNSDAESTDYVFEIVPGFAHETSSADIDITEVTTFKSEHGFDVVSEKRSVINLYPSLPKQIQINFEAPNEFFPENSQPVGKISFESSATKKIEYELPIKFKF